MYALYYYIYILAILNKIRYNASMPIYYYDDFKIINFLPF